MTTKKEQEQRNVYSITLYNRISRQEELAKEKHASNLMKGIYSINVMRGGPSGFKNVLPRLESRTAQAHDLNTKGRS